MKAKIISKIVREESGEHTYTLIPPIEEIPRKIWGDPIETINEMHPLFRPYFQAAVLKPTMTSFGHRPKSASRIFNPATMKIHLKHDEIVKTNISNNNKTSFGIPVTTLAKLLHTPKLPNFGETLHQRNTKSSPNSLFENNQFYPENVLEETNTKSKRYFNQLKSFKLSYGKYVYIDHYFEENIVFVVK